MNDVCFGVGLSIILPLKETKILALPPSTSLNVLLQFVHLHPNEEPVEVVEQFQSFGTIISPDHTLDREINGITSKAAHTLGSLYKVLWCSRKVKPSTKMCQFKSV